MLTDRATMWLPPKTRSSYSECVWRPSPGKYKLHAVTTDVDGMAGKSEVIEVEIERPSSPPK